MGDANVRTKRFIANVSAAVVTRILGTALSYAVVPVTLRALGEERYALVATITIAANWIQVAGLGASRSLVNELQSAIANGQTAAARRLLGSSLVGHALLAFTAFVGATVLLYLLGANTLFPSSLNSMNEVEHAAVLAIASAATTLALSPISTALSALQRDSQLSWWTLLRSTLVLIAALIVAICDGGLRNYFLLTGGASLCASGFLASWFFFVGHPTMRFSPGDVSLASFVKLLRSGLGFAGVDAAALAVFQFDRFILLHASGAQAVAQFDLCAKLFQFGHGVLSLALGPAWPALGAAFRAGDIKWAGRTYRMLSVALVTAMTGWTLVAVFFGPALIALLGSTFPPPHWSLFASLGTAYSLRVWTDVNAVALYSLARARDVLISAVAHALFYIGSAPVAAVLFGPTGVAACGALSIAATSAWWLPRRLRSALIPHATFAP